MNEYLIECTVCSKSFCNERKFDKHTCCANDCKIPFRIKLEMKEDSIENSRSNGFTPIKIPVKEEPIDDSAMEGNDPLDMADGSDQDLDEDPDNGDVDGDDDENVDDADFDPQFPLENVTQAVALRKDCGICGKHFYRQQDYLVHLENSHKSPRPFACKICNKTFTQRHYVTLHMRVHTGEKPYKCALCPNSYAHKTSFTIHMRIHNDDRPYKCNECGKLCYDKSGMTSHMRSHTKETPFECEVCGRRFTHSKSLLVHRRNHTGEKPYNCSWCGKNFRHWHKHKIHLRLHTGERPYRCEICNKGFPRNDEVKRHMRSHQGIKPFKCSICGVYCATQVSITGHIDLHHSNLKPNQTGPEKTLVQDSFKGVLGTKAPASQTKHLNIPPRVSKNCWSSTSTAHSSTAPPEGVELTKVLSYKDFMELQEKLLAEKGLVVKESDILLSRPTDILQKTKSDVGNDVATLRSNVGTRLQTLSVINKIDIDSKEKSQKTDQTNATGSTANQTSGSIGRGRQLIMLQPQTKSGNCDQMTQPLLLLGSGNQPLVLLSANSISKMTENNQQLTFDSVSGQIMLTERTANTKLNVEGTNDPTKKCNVECKQLIASKVAIKQEPPDEFDDTFRSSTVGKFLNVVIKQEPPDA